MPGQRKLMVWTNQGEYGATRPQDDLYTCDWYEFQGSWLVMHNAWDSGNGRHTTLSINNAVRVEER